MTADFPADIFVFDSPEPIDAITPTIWSILRNRAKGEISNHLGIKSVMKMVIAIIQPTKLQAVQEALARCHIERMTICDAQGYARQRGHTPIYRDCEYKIDLLRKVELEIVVNDDFLETCIDTVTQAARTGPKGSIGDGKIFVLSVDDTIGIDGIARGPGVI
jgi:nitrogen regulatory protein P-II 1